MRLFRPIAIIAAALSRIRLVWKSELDRLYGRVLSAVPEDKAGAVRNAIGAFARSVEAREAALRLLYPDDPALVEELLARQVMLRVLRLCALEAELS